MHVADELAHVREGRSSGPDDDLESGMQRPQFEVGDDDGDLDELIRVEIEARHLAVDPYEPVVPGKRPSPGTS